MDPVPQRFRDSILPFSPVDTPAQFLSRPEVENISPVDIHLFACLRISADARFVITNTETPEIANLDPPTSGQRIRYAGQNDIHHELGIFMTSIFHGCRHVVHQFGFVH
uniref:Uncharacterized protein n=1 Tax=Candidatus Kentrum eta TaxID=2126337 RepID=A0A450VMF8_9GAMM|nr:MAG: hypothetical protein BECKH772B_GA0070898_103242 [Candidatus Kentron sp. H]VFK03378.1 MAG: hypothetical protein BECKH772A_GA0070896_103212 [Candidatus Kentron sp. H]VFK05979.1 MAG: hypothetical protein BECKH772C_GA0070978_103182 [Candidatus Kentron sp. H]